MSARLIWIGFTVKWARISIDAVKFGMPREGTDQSQLTQFFDIAIVYIIMQSSCIWRTLGDAYNRNWKIKGLIWFFSTCRTILIQAKFMLTPNFSSCRELRQIQIFIFMFLKYIYKELSNFLRWILVNFSNCLKIIQNT